jgi:hypothetical protein
MRKKFLLYFAFMLANLSSYCQKDLIRQMTPLSKQYFVSNQAESRDREFSKRAIDGNLSTSTLINNQQGFNWWQVNMKFVRKIAGVKITATNLNQFYVFISKAPFNHVNLNSLLQDPWVKYSYVNNLTEDIIPISGICQYIMVLPINGDAYYLNEVSPYGYENEGPNDPHVEPPYIIGPPLGPPYGTCGPWWWPPNNPPICPIKPPYIIGPPFIGPDTPVGPGFPWWGNWEICNNGIDDDLNGLIDCEDYPCGVGWFNVVETMPTCPICSDGQVCIYSYPPVTQVSIDGGSTWTNVTHPSGETCFNNLSTGTYNVVLKTNAGCTDGESIILEAPKGTHDDCFNGGFEEGDFNGWTGGTGGVYPSSFSNTSISPPQHQILNNAFTDPLAPFITGIDGVYCARLGDGNSGNESQRLTYCLTVDNMNANFTFNWAAVMELPNGHTSGYFEYNITDNTTGQNIFQSPRTTAASPFLQNLGGDLRAIGWTCEQHNLSAFIGHQVCIEFITSNCTCTGHRAYAYIDGLCNAGSYSPEINIIANDIYCTGQKIEVEVEGTGFQQSNWRISKVDANGNETGVITTPVINSPTVPKIDDLIQLYLANGGGAISCPQTLKLQLTVYSGTTCGEYLEEKSIKVVCPNYTIDYCDPLLYCIGANTDTLHIKGLNNCADCKYEWGSNEQGGTLGLVNRFSKFPWLDRSIAFNAFDKRYFVNIETPEGCKYYDEFSAERYEIEIIKAEIKNISYCDYNIEGSILLSHDLANQDIAIKAINVIDSSEIEGSTIGTGLNRSFIFTVDRQSLTKMKIVVMLAGDYFCKTGDCGDYIQLEEVSAPFASQWKAIWPNVFCAENNGIFGLHCDEVNEEFHITFNNSVDSTCVVENPAKSSIYYYNLAVYDRWGNKVFDDTVSVTPLVNNGILGTELSWNGWFNDEPVEAGVYTFIARIKSCYNNNGLPCDECCNIGTGSYSNCTDAIKNGGYWNYCAQGINNTNCLGNNNNSDFEIICGDITVLR